MSYKRRPKNKQELPPKRVKKKELPKKTIVEFGFTTQDGINYNNGTGRIKINEKGEITCLIRDEEEKWKNVKGKLDYVRMKSIVIKKVDTIRKKKV
jgi:hypothetical protein